MPRSIPFVIILSLLVPGFALAQLTEFVPSLNRLKQRVVNLEARVVALQSSDKNMQAMAMNEQRVSGLQNDLRLLTGQVEHLGYKIEQVEASLARLDALEMRMERKLEELSRAPVAPPLEQRSEHNALEVPLEQESVPENPEDSYDAALKQLRAGRYNEAANGFQNFLARFPDHVLAGNAYYWFAESAYAQGEFETAAARFAQGYRTYPQSSKAPDNLLKFALSQFQLNKQSEGCQALSGLIARHKEENPEIWTRAKEALQTQGCPSS